MTMQINRGQLIAGYPAFKIRHLLRYVRLREAVTSRFLAYVLKIEKQEDAELLAANLSQLGFLNQLKKTPVGYSSENAWYEITELGISLANASAAPRIKRRTAERLVEDLMDRVNQVNANERYVYRVSAVVVFGSFISDRGDLGDVDIAIELSPRISDQNAFTKMCTSKIVEAYEEGRAFRNITDEVLWPRNEVRLFLRNRRRGLSLRDIGELQALAEGRHFKYRILLGNKKAIRKLLGPTAREV